MLTPDNLHGYQRTANNHQLMQSRSMLWLGMGLGKTVVTLTTICQRKVAKQIRGTLVIAPLRVVHGVWEQEAKKWSHTSRLTFSKMVGNEKQRRKALFAKADVYLINYENLNWLTEELFRSYLDHGDSLPFDMVVYDEVSRMKNAGQYNFSTFAGRKIDHDNPFEGKRWVEIIRGWKEIAPRFTYRTGLTGTPASNGYLNLFGQFLAIDDGERLGKFITLFKNAYFKSDYNGWNFEVTEIGKAAIHDKIESITIEMAAEDYLELPACVINNIMVDLPAKARKAYKELEKELFTVLDSGSEIELSTKASVYNKCLQLCNGTVYTDTDTKASEAIHKAKLEALDDIIEEAAGQPVLCSYSYIIDAKRIMKRYNRKSFKVVNLTESKASALPKIIKAWNSGKIQLLLGHPASMGHGVDGLQHSGSIIVWFGLNWSLELYEQMNARIDRQGQTKTTVIHRILCNDSVDLVVADGLSRKDDTQNGLKAAMNRYRQGITTNELKLNFL